MNKVKLCRLCKESRRPKKMEIHDKQPAALIKNDVNNEMLLHYEQPLTNFPSILYMFEGVTSLHTPNR